MKPAFKQKQWRKAGELIDKMRYCKTCRQQTQTKVQFTGAAVYYVPSFSPAPNGEVMINWGHPQIKTLGYFGKVVCVHCGTEKSKALTELIESNLT